MSTANLLNTTTVNYQELVGNGKVYTVPPYQRDYSWTEDQWEDLWLDIQDLRADTSNRHYMGAVVVKAQSDREFLIIDGQQRITTLTILGLAVIHQLQQLAAQPGGESNAERAVTLRGRFIGEKSLASLTEISKLSLNAHDDGFFQDNLVQLRAPQNARGLTRSNRLLWDCFRFFEQQIAGDESLNSDSVKLAQVLSEVVARQLVFILITVDDEINAYTVFETLNARGLELTTTDLLKNYLFSRVQAPGDLEALQRRWQRLVETARHEKFGEFLRYHYLTKQPQIRSARLFKIVRDEVKSPQQVLDLLAALEVRAPLFEALTDPHNAFWLDFEGAATYVRELNLFRVRQMTPLLFAAHERLSPAEFVKILRLVAVIEFRHTVIGGLSAYDAEPAYHHAAKAILAGSATTAGHVFQPLRELYVADDKFESDFAQKSVATSGQRKKLVKYILCQLESDAAARACDFETDPGTTEHIFPENPAAAWEESFPVAQWEAAVYRLGNLTLLSASANREVGSKLYAEKLPLYAQSQYNITRAIEELAPDEWTLARLNARQRRMAARACHIWRCDFTGQSS